MSTSAAGLHLEVISGSAAGSTIHVEDELVIGRHELDGMLSEDVEISRQHARISREATGEYAIEDLGSSNGTFVNGLRIQTPRLLTLGDSIETGNTTLVVKEIARPGASKTAISAVPDVAQPDPRFAATSFARAPPLPASAPPSTAPPPAKPATLPAPTPAPQPTPAQPPAAPETPAPPSPPPANAPPQQPAPAPPASTPEPQPASAGPPPAAPEPHAVPAPPSSPPSSPPEATPAPSPAPTPAPQPEPAPPLELRLEVDFDARQATIALGDDGQAIELAFEDGRWRARPVEQAPADS